MGKRRAGFTRASETVAIASEHDHQVAFFDWVRLMREKDWRFHLITATPNAGQRSIGAARYMKAEGLTAGWPDISIMIPTKDYAGAFIEMKSKKGKLTEEQMKTLLYLEKAGYLTEVCRSAEEAIGVVTRYFYGEDTDKLLVD